MRRSDLIAQMESVQTQLDALQQNKFVRYNQIHADGWRNILSGMGYSQHDKRKNTTYGSPHQFAKGDLEELYAGEGILTRMVDIPINDAIREWFFVEGEPEGLALDELDRLDAKAKVKEGYTWADLFGGGIINMIINDGQDPEEAVNKNNIQTIIGLHVYDRHDVVWNDSDLYEDLDSENYGKPEVYTIFNRTTGATFRVHETRVLVFDGQLVTDNRRARNQGWGDSIVQRWYDKIRGFADGLAASENLITEFIIGIMKMKNLDSLLDSPEGEKQIRQRLQLMDMSKNILNTNVIDENESFERISSAGVGGMADLLTLSKNILPAVSGIPIIKLWQEQTKGLGSEASGNIRFYYDDISLNQEMKLLKPMRRLVEYIFLQKQGPFRGVAPDTWAIVFNTLWQQTAKEEAETKKITAETDLIYYQMGFPMALIMLNRFGGSRYSKDMVLPEKVQDALVKLAEQSILIGEQTKEEDPPNAEEE